MAHEMCLETQSFMYKRHAYKVPVIIPRSLNSSVITYKDKYFRNFFVAVKYVVKGFIERHRDYRDFT